MSTTPSGAMSVSAPLLSVVVPTYDRHATLAECLARLAPGAQSLDATAYEVIVTDDARSARTEEFLAARFPWARYTAGPAGGPAANRNHGASAARGEWIVFTDDDTLPSRDWLAAYATATVSGGGDALEGRTTCAAGFGTPMHYAPVNERGGLFWSCNIAVRAATFRAIGGFDEGFVVAHMEDQDLRERLRAAQAAFAWVPDAVVDHPPRRQPSGRTLGLQRRAEVRYLYKHGAARPVRWRLLRGVASLRVGIIRALPWSGDSLRAVVSLAQESWTVLTHAPAWEAESAREFPVPAPTSVAVRDSRVSVIVPAYRRADALARCLRALAAQTHPPHEVIVVVRADDVATIAAARAASVIIETVQAPGVIAAMQAGLARATGGYIALTDDDAEPRADWLERCAAVLDREPEVVGVGGRDWQPLERGDARDVGRVQWFGRTIGRHHLGAGPARRVDLLKGVNCCFRAGPLRAVGFDARLRGEGAQVHWELATCLPLRRAGWRLVYDPAIAVDHHVAPRVGADQVHRGAFAAEPFADAVHNETLALIEHLSGMRLLAFHVWSSLVGTTSSPGLLAAVRLRAQGHTWAWAAWRAARRARGQAADLSARTSPRA